MTTTAPTGARPGGPGLILGPGPAGAWDSERVSCPRVLRAADGSWRMWYYGRDPTFDRLITLPTGRVGLATSPDGVHWTRVSGPLTMGSIFEPHPDATRFDSGHVGISDIQLRDDLYWMWYLGGDQALRTMGPMKFRGFPALPGCAVSRDGVNWLRVEGPHRGALLPPGAPGEFDAFMVGWPQVIRWDDGSWRMYYHSLDAQQVYTLGWASSSDGLRWQKRGPIMGAGEKGRFDDRGVATRHIVRLGGRWTMFYEGCKDIGQGFTVGRQLGVAVSDDGLAWTRVDGPAPDGAVLAGSPSGSGLWDHRLGCPWVVPLPGGALRLYYIGSHEREGGGELDGIQQIGLATSTGDATRWVRHPTLRAATSASGASIGAAAGGNADPELPVTVVAGYAERYRA